MLVYSISAPTYQNLDDGTHGPANGINGRLNNRAAKQQLKFGVKLYFSLTKCFKITESAAKLFQIARLPQYRSLSVSVAKIHQVAAWFAGSVALYK
jgi:hypothetical protein